MSERELSCLVKAQTQPIARSYRRGAPLPGRVAPEDENDLVLRVLLHVRRLNTKRSERLAPQPLFAEVTADEAPQLVRVAGRRAGVRPVYQGGHNKIAHRLVTDGWATPRCWSTCST